MVDCKKKCLKTFNIVLTYCAVGLNKYLNCNNSSTPLGYLLLLWMPVSISYVSPFGKFQVEGKTNILFSRMLNRSIRNPKGHVTILLALEVRLLNKRRLTYCTRITRTIIFFFWWTTKLPFRVNPDLHCLNMFSVFKKKNLL